MGTPIKLYFDPMTDLLTRFVYYNDTPAGPDSDAD
jgi:hypothetical protein